jgi:hypothetical protein
MDSLEKMLSMLLGGAVEVLDISADLHREAVARYEEVGDWLSNHGSPGLQIYPQGSFRLGTVVRPSRPTGEYDIDLVCLLPLQRTSTTQEQLKQRVGEQLAAYVRWKRQQGHGDGPTELIARRRCWTLVYPGFHLDVLPSIPDDELPPTGILLTDKELREWQHSNPIGYAEWFGRRSELARVIVEKRNANVATVPLWEFRMPLQRVVQVLKWHCMTMFKDDLDNRPPSILITTLAGWAYAGQEDLFTATHEVLQDMHRYVEDRHGKWWVANPAHEDENFTDKWNEYPERREAFYNWHNEISVTMKELAQMQGMGARSVFERIAKSFDPDPVRHSYAKYATAMGAATDLRMGPGGQLSSTVTGPRKPSHTFDGQPSSTRG